MKIGSDRTLVNLDAYIKNTPNSTMAKPSAKQVPGEQVQTESVKLSTRARELKKAREVVDATPEIREEKVGRLKQEIVAGTYEVSGDKVAEKMLRESLMDAFV